MKLRLDANTIPGLTLPDGKIEEIFWDADLTGFGLRVKRSRARGAGNGRVLRTWISQFRINGRQRRPTIGSAETLTAGEARKAARKILAAAALGHDTQAEREAERRHATRTFRSVAEAYLEAQRGELRPESIRIAKLYLLGSYFQPLHSVAIHKIEHPDIAHRIRAIERGHSAVTAAAARRAASTLFSWAMADGLMGRNPVNPVTGTYRPKDSEPGDRTLDDDELVKVWQACGDDDFGHIIRLLILLGARRQEIGNIKWSELDLEAGTWTLPAERSKNHFGYTVTLPTAALEILRSVPQLNGRDPLFGARGRGFTSWNLAKAELDRRAGDTVKSWKIHDLRRTFATRLGDLGIPPHIIEVLLNHRSGFRRGIASIYNKSPYEREARNALERWAAHVITLTEGRTNNVIPYPA